MKSAAVILAGAAALSLLLAPLNARAGPWTQPRGKGQVIVKYEDMRADRAFDPSGDDLPLPGGRRDVAAGIFAEYGVTDRLTLQFKADWQDGQDAFVDFEGRGPLEIGATWQVWRSDRAAISLYGAYAEGGQGRNAGYASPGVGESDWEVRASAGRSFGPGRRRWSPTGRFIEVQAARRFRSGLPDETRIDLTYGSHHGENWMFLTQAFGGLADQDQLGREGPRWLSVETSVVRRLGSWSLQGGWRRTIAGRETPRASGPVISVWRRF